MANIIAFPARESATLIEAPAIDEVAGLLECLATELEARRRLSGFNDNEMHILSTAAHWIWQVLDGRWR